MSLANHVRNAIHQLKQGETIGRRGTPVISFWPMRDKWIKWGPAWETIGTDGDAEVLPEGRLRLPAVLKLVYFKLDNQVCQLAYILQPEVNGGATHEQQVMYERGRCNMPQSMAIE